MVRASNESVAGLREVLVKALQRNSRLLPVGARTTVSLNKKLFWSTVIERVSRECDVRRIINVDISSLARWIEGIAAKGTVLYRNGPSLASIDSPSRLLALDCKPVT